MISVYTQHAQFRVVEYREASRFRLDPDTGALHIEADGDDGTPRAIGLHANHEWIYARHDDQTVTAAGDD